MSAAVAAATLASGAYQIIAIAPGVYGGAANDVTLPTTKPKFLILGLGGPANTIIDGTGLGSGPEAGWVVQNAAVIASLTFRKWTGAAVNVNNPGLQARLVDLIVRQGAGTASNSPGALWLQGGTNYVTSSTIVDNTASSSYGQVYAYMGTAVLSNTVIGSTGATTSLVSSQSTVTTNNCLAKGQTLSGTGNLAGSVAAKIRSDGHLRSDSPLRAAGGAPQSRIEMDGELRPSSAPDIGVDHFVDADADNLPDAWEIATFGSITAVAGGDDPDSDGLTNAMEYDYETDRLKADTDGDGLPDGMEVSMGKNPLVLDETEDVVTDVNQDGLLDSIDVQLRYSLNKLDEDGDSISNADEIRMCMDPFRADSDGDGVPDGTDAFPLDPRMSVLPSPPDDVTPPVITLTSPWYAVEQ